MTDAYSALSKFSTKFKSYEEAHTEWAIFFLKLMETILTLACLLLHIQALTGKYQLPHHVLFCATFGGFFILSFAGMLVPISGQLSPPGVDLMFSCLAFTLLFSSACLSMYYIAIDPYLKHDEIDDYMEMTYPFFVTCYYHCVLSLITGTFFLMHAVISADRLTGMKKGYIEVKSQANLDIIPTVDIPDDKPLSLYLFFFDYIHYVHNSKLCVRCRKCLGLMKEEGDKQQGRTYKKRRLSPHQKAHLKARLEHLRRTGQRVQSFIETSKNEKPGMPTTSKRAWFPNQK